MTVLGGDPVLGQPRLTLGIGFIEGGIPFLPVLIGVFAFAQIMSEVERMGGAAAAAERANRAIRLAVSHVKVIWEIVSRPFLLLWASFIGVLIGVLPAIGGSAANMHGLRPGEEILAPSREASAPACPEGIIASESSNNANVGGSLVTIMAFGIPGDAVTAVMLGALTIHGIQSGPLFISQNAQLAYGMFAAYLLAHPIMVVILLAGGALDAVHRRRSRNAVLFPVVLVLCVIGAYALNNTDGQRLRARRVRRARLRMVKFGFPLAPFILGVILGDQIEINLIRAIMSDPDPWLFVTRPISGVLLALSVASVVAAIWQHRRHQRRAAAAPEAEEAADF